ncbi:MAG TPA: S41 family peptidase [Phnomibacter sp.]|nr:S41 family peptidase [Phnomibacter sp.]
MKKLFTMAALFFSVQGFSQNTAFLSQPSLTPDGSTIYFCFESDIWKVPAGGGQASRVTAMPGFEQNPRVSPDGKWLAFNNNQYGNNDIYLMPLNGGAIQQLTYNSANDVMNSWSWDNQHIYFSSNRYNRSAGYKIGINGGTPQRVFNEYYFSFDHLLVEHPLTHEVFFNNTWESDNQQFRKRYTGPFNPDIQSYNPASGEYKQYTQYEGKDFYATIDKQGNLYFLSDEGTGEYNLFSLKNGTKTALTKFNTSSKAPQVNAQGGKIVFEKDYQLWLYDVASAKASVVKIEMPVNKVLGRMQDFDVKGKISNFDISPDGKKLAFISRGEIFVSDIEGKYTMQVKKGNDERATELIWLADNKTLLYTQTQKGYLNLFTVAADGSQSPKNIISATEDCRGISYNKKRTQAVYVKGKKEVCLLDLKSFTSKTLVKDEFWGMFSVNPIFSPDDNWIMYCAYRNFEHDIFVYELKTGRQVNLTKTGVSETEPFWSPDGKYIYFAHNPTQPSYPMGGDGNHIFRLPLEKWDEPYKLAKFQELFRDSVKKKDSVFVTISTEEDFMRRIEQVSPSFGAQDGAFVLKKSDKTTVLYNSDHGEGKTALWKTMLEPFTPEKTEKVCDGNTFNIIETADGKLYALNGGSIVKLDIENKKADPLNISYTFRRNLQGEFAQMFDEAWARLEINFYDETFHGVDWKAVHERYSKFVPLVNNRADLTILLNDMLGELNSSHTGFSSNGDDIKPPFASSTMETGIVWDEANPFKVKRIIKRSAADKKDIDILPGDELVVVNDVLINKDTDRSFYFTQPSADKEMVLRFKRGDKEKEVRIHPQSGLSNLLYDEWIDSRQQIVNEQSKNRIAYHHMKNMSSGELQVFLTDMTQDFYQKDALILDLRYNTGGNVHDQVLRFLSQRSYLQWKYREGKLSPQSNFAPSDKPIVLLINEQSLSDAEMTATGFKALKLGKIIGNETYRWIIFTSGAGLVDGSFVRLPSWGCYTNDGKDIEKVGVQPDIKIINTWKDKMTNKDPQLDAAIAEIMKQLK